MSVGVRVITFVVSVSLLMLSGCSQFGERTSAEKDPEHAARIYADLGLGYLRQGKYDMALEKLKRSLELDGDNAPANHYIAELYNRTDDIKLADKHFKRAVKLDGENPMVLNNYGAFLCKQSRFDEAEEYFQRSAVTPRYRSPELAYENLGLCAVSVDNHEMAERYFRKALKLKPDMAKSLYQMAKISQVKKDNMRGRAFLQRFHAVSRPTPQSLVLGIKIENALGDVTQAKEYQETLRKRFPDHEDAQMDTTEE